MREEERVHGMDHGRDSEVDDPGREGTCGKLGDGLEHYDSRVLGLSGVPELDVGLATIHEAFVDDLDAVDGLFVPHAESIGDVGEVAGIDAAKHRRGEERSDADVEREGDKSVPLRPGKSHADSTGNSVSSGRYVGRQELPGDLAGDGVALADFGAGVADPYRPIAFCVEVRDETLAFAFY
jgi:hypothetical protein